MTDTTVQTSTYASLLSDAVHTLTAAARLTRPAPGRPDQPGPIDWAEFVTQVLAGAAANVGGIEAVLAGRPGSWEADGVRQILISTLGDTDEELLRHRTEPVVVEFYVDEILNDRGIWTAYDEAGAELYRRREPYLYRDGEEPPVLTSEQEREDDALAELEERLEEQRVADWTAYGDALRAHIEQAAARRPGLGVPVVVRVDLDNFRGDGDRGLVSDFVTIGDELLDDALLATPLPGDGRGPLQRLEEGPGTAGNDSGPNNS